MARETHRFNFFLGGQNDGKKIGHPVVHVVRLQVVVCIHIGGRADGRRDRSRLRLFCGNEDW